MISAFPEEKPILHQGEPRTDLVSLVSALLPALINQARFKPSEILVAGTWRILTDADMEAGSALDDADLLVPETAG